VSNGSRNASWELCYGRTGLPIKGKFHKEKGTDVGDEVSS